MLHCQDKWNYILKSNEVLLLRGNCICMQKLCQFYHVQNPLE